MSDRHEPGTLIGIVRNPHVAPLQHANAAFASGPLALPGPEPTRSLQFSSLAAFAVAIRHRDSRHSHSLDGLLIL